jgi:hypothetical protein
MIYFFVGATRTAAVCPEPATRANLDDGGAHLRRESRGGPDWALRSHPRRMQYSDRRGCSGASRKLNLKQKNIIIIK